MIEKNLNFPQGYEPYSCVFFWFNSLPLSHRELDDSEAVYEVHIPSASYNQSLIYLLQFWTCMKCGALLSFLCNDSFRPLIN